MGFFLEGHSPDWEAAATNNSKGGSDAHKEKYFAVTGKALAKFTQRGCGTSVLGGVLDSTGQALSTCSVSLVSPALGWWPPEEQSNLSPVVLQDVPME